jgi:saccharopine dehydrogenase-like NADP-dependent oxidoreductase
MKLPLKTRMLEYAVKSEGSFTVNDMIRDLKKEYDGEKIFRRKQVEEYFDALLGVGFFKDESLEFDDEDNLIVRCNVTDYGRLRARYIPKEHD